MFCVYFGEIEKIEMKREEKGEVKWNEKGKSNKFIYWFYYFSVLLFFDNFVGYGFMLFEV